MKGDMLIEVAECPKCGLRIPYRPDCIEYMQAKRIMELESLVYDMHECCMYIGALPPCADEAKRIIGRMEDCMGKFGLEVDESCSVRKV